MSTPAVAANAYAALARLGDQAASLGRDSGAQPGGPDFSAILKDVMTSVTAVSYTHLTLPTKRIV